MAKKEWQDDLSFSDEELSELNRGLENRASVSSAGRPRRRTRQRGVPIARRRSEKTTTAELAPTTPGAPAPLTQGAPPHINTSRLQTGAQPQVRQPAGKPGEAEVSPGRTKTLPMLSAVGGAASSASAPATPAASTAASSAPVVAAPATEARPPSAVATATESALPPPSADNQEIFAPAAEPDFVEPEEMPTEPFVNVSEQIAATYPEGAATLEMRMTPELLAELDSVDRPAASERIGGGSDEDVEELNAEELEEIEEVSSPNAQSSEPTSPAPAGNAEAVNSEGESSEGVAAAISAAAQALSAERTGELHLDRTFDLDEDHSGAVGASAAMEELAERHQVAEDEEERTNRVSILLSALRARRKASTGEEASVAEASVAEASVAEASVAEACVAEASVAEASVAEASVAEASVAEASVDAPLGPGDTSRSAPAEAQPAEEGAPASPFPLAADLVEGPRDTPEVAPQAAEPAGPLAPRDTGDLDIDIDVESVPPPLPADEAEAPSPFRPALRGSGEVRVAVDTEQDDADEDGVFTSAMPDDDEPDGEGESAVPQAAAAPQVAPAASQAAPQPTPRAAPQAAPAAPQAAPAAPQPTPRAAPQAAPPAPQPTPRAPAAPQGPASQAPAPTSPSPAPAPEATPVAPQAPAPASAPAPAAAKAEGSSEAPKVAPRQGQIPTDPAHQAVSPPSPPKAPAAGQAPKAPPAAPPTAPQRPAATETPRKRAKAWFEEIFDEEYLRTIPFATAELTQAETAFIEGCLELERESPVLDLGCGTGRHALDLAARGHTVTGLDLSLPLLIRAADEAQRRELQVNFVHSDFRELSFEGQFAAAYCMNTSFGFFDDDTNRKIIQSINRALRPGGRFLLEVVNRDYVTRDLPGRIWWEGSRCVILEEVDFNYFTSRLQSKRSVVFEDGRHAEQEISIRLYSLHELGKILHHAGFRVLEVTGHHAHRTRFFGNQSRSLILLAERR